MKRTTEIQVGLTVIAAMAVLIWGVTWLREFKVGKQVRLWHVTFPQTGGLGPSDEVQVNGIRKGSVATIDLAGDHVLKEVSNIVRSRIRRNEVFSRYGGEEFALLLPETDVRGASTLAQEIRTLVASHDFIFDNQHIPVTVSLGVAQWNPNVRTADEFIRIADVRLYQAKREGRNRVVS